MPKRRKFFIGSEPKKDKQMERTEAVAETDLTFIRLVKERMYPDALKMMDQVEDINVRDPQTQATALHFSAHHSCVEFIDALEKHSDLDYLAQDAQDKYPSELAWDVAGNEKLGARLIQKEKEQADREGVQIWPKTPPTFDSQPN